ncbi:Hypothetical_protein [Hexamita inflata]|uniref:Hypothetical_protein n=1 Tax=Hexamita inflata TaxID=28002 RepID=A0AA86R9B7_9EUKA|nr:Hypothetical protein HINF_LOCUS61461 [Hexamita inflata]
MGCQSQQLSEPIIQDHDLPKLVPLQSAMSVNSQRSNTPRGNKVSQYNYGGKSVDEHNFKEVLQKLIAQGFPKRPSQITVYLSDQTDLLVLKHKIILRSPTQIEFDQLRQILDTRLQVLTLLMTFQLKNQKGVKEKLNQSRFLVEKYKYDLTKLPDKLKKLKQLRALRTTDSTKYRRSKADSKLNILQITLPALKMKLTQLKLLRQQIPVLELSIFNKKLEVLKSNQVQHLMWTRMCGKKPKQNAVKLIGSDHVKYKEPEKNETAYKTEAQLLCEKLNRLNAQPVRKIEAQDTKEQTPEVLPTPKVENTKENVIVQKETKVQEKENKEEVQKAEEKREPKILSDDEFEMQLKRELRVKAAMELHKNLVTKYTQNINQKQNYQEANKIYLDKRNKIKSLQFKKNELRQKHKAAVFNNLEKLMIRIDEAKTKYQQLKDKKQSEKQREMLKMITVKGQHIIHIQNLNTRGKQTHINVDQTKLNLSKLRSTLQEQSQLRKLIVNIENKQKLLAKLVAHRQQVKFSIMLAKKQFCLKHLATAQQSLISSKNAYAQLKQTKCVEVNLALSILKVLPLKSQQLSTLSLSLSTLQKQFQSSNALKHLQQLNLTLNQQFQSSISQIKLLRLHYQDLNQPLISLGKTAISSKNVVYFDLLRQKRVLLDRKREIIVEKANDSLQKVETVKSTLEIGLQSFKGELIEKLEQKRVQMQIMIVKAQMKHKGEEKDMLDE